MEKKNWFTTRNVHSKGFRVFFYILFLTFLVVNFFGHPVYIGFLGWDSFSILKRKVPWL